MSEATRFIMENWVRPYGILETFQPAKDASLIERREWVICSWCGDSAPGWYDGRSNARDYLCDPCHSVFNLQHRGHGFQICQGVGKKDPLTNERGSRETVQNLVAPKPRYNGYAIIARDRTIRFVLKEEDRKDLMSFVKEPIWTHIRVGNFLDAVQESLKVPPPFVFFSVKVTNQKVASESIRLTLSSRAIHLFDESESYVFDGILLKSLWASFLSRSSSEKFIAAFKDWHVARFKMFTQESPARKRFLDCLVSNPELMEFFQAIPMENDTAEVLSLLFYKWNNLKKKSVKEGEKNVA